MTMQRVGPVYSDVSALIQHRPRLILGLLTTLLGVVLATWQARRYRLRHGRRKFKAALDLPPLVGKLLANPIVQDYLRRTVTRGLSRKLGR